MIQHFRRHLILLFTSATGIILTLVLCITFFYQFTLSRSQGNETFQNQLLDLTHRLEGNSSFSDDWLAKLEADGRLIIHIEENNIPLFFSGSWTPRTNRDTLIALAEEKALEEQVDVSLRPYSSSLQKSSIFSLQGEHRDTYLGTAIVLSTDNGFRSLILLMDTTERSRAFLLQILFFFLLEAVGLLSLFLVSRCVVGKAMQPIEEYHQKQTDFVAAASHELRSPLAVIQTCASAITSMPEQAPQMAELIQRECNRSGKLIKNLLLLSSADAGNLAEEMQEVEIDTLLLQLLEAYEPLCSANHIHLKLALPEEFLPNVLGNYQWIYQLLAILLDNAIAHGYPQPPDAPVPESEKPVIRLAAALHNQYVSVSVTDHGTGIPDDQKTRIFDRFYRADPSRNKKEHSGLGLSIADTLASQMRLSIQVKDTPGGGTTFSVNLPACP